ncbi:lactadherin isoform X3 [Pezoporus flaviventris]|uniref:lactadherin isoform X3 n=1 Tax=Pezoporus flaviventris TaxID=889875 RepID=UPI002AAF78E8|nr:lactadherin isoform X3 [Pezoporus flaviventris]
MLRAEGGSVCRCVPCLAEGKASPAFIPPMERNVGGLCCKTPLPPAKCWQPPLLPIQLCPLCLPARAGSQGHRHPRTKVRCGSLRWTPHSEHPQGAWWLLWLQGQVRTPAPALPALRGAWGITPPSRSPSRCPSPPRGRAAEHVGPRRAGLSHSLPRAPRRSGAERAARLGSHRRGSVRLGSSMGAVAVLRVPRLSRAPRPLQVLFPLVLRLSLPLVVTGDFCDVNHCQNGGTCLTGINETPFFCICPEGYVGIDCNETEKGPCHPNPCHNNGECQLVPNRGDVFTDYICKCPAGYDGVHCQNNKNECSSQPCKNGGTCLDLDGDYTCKCPSPFLGKTCHIRCAILLGMEGGAISDAQLSASSVYYGFLGLQRWGPELARLNNHGIVNAWTSSDYDKSPWIQANLLRKMRLSGIITQGARRVGQQEFVRAYKVAYSLDGREFTFCKDEKQDTDKVFPGNVDYGTMQTNMFNPPITAQFIRIYPVMCRRACTLRFELIGCEMNVYFNTAGCSEPLGMKSRLISDQQITASSVFKTWGIDAFTWHPHYARLDKTGKTNAWTALNNDQSEWLQIDLQDQKKVTGIITQGARDFGHIQYVAAYKVAYSDNGTSWTLYKDGQTNSTKIFHGNSDNYSHKKNVFDVPFYARFIRILPVAWHNRITLRVELLGCDE